MQITIAILFTFLSLNLQAQDSSKYNRAMDAGNHHFKATNYDSALTAFLSLNLQAQRDCPKYTKAMDAGNYYLKATNYDSALIQFQVAQVAARECGKVTDTPAIKLREVFKGLKAQRDEAIRQKNAAIEARKLALQEKKRAGIAQEKTEIQKEAFRLITLAHQKVDKNPTIALRLAEQALKRYPDSLIYAAAQEIYARHAFYKTLIKDSYYEFSPLAFSPDGTKIITGSTKHYAGIQLWSTGGDSLKEFIGHTSPVTSLCFSPDNKKFLSVSMDSTVKIWDVNDTLIKTIKLETGYIRSGIFLPDGQTFLTGSEDSTVRLWDKNGVLIREFRDLKGSIYGLSCSPDGSLIFACADNSDTIMRNACLWNIDGTMQRPFWFKDIFIGAYVQNKLKIISRDSTTRFKLWDAESGSVTTFNTSPSSIYSINFSPDGNKILVGSEDSVVRLFDIKGAIEKEYKGLKEEATVVAFSPDGMNIFSGSRDNTIKQWSREGELLKVSKEKSSRITSTAVSRDGKMIFTSYEDSTATLWTGSGDILKHFRWDKSIISAAAFSPGGAEIFTGSVDSILRIWSVNGDLIKEFPKTAEIVSIDCSPDNTQILTASTDNIIRVLNRSGAILKELKGFTGEMSSAVFSPDSLRVLTIDALSNRYANYIKLWDANARLIHKYKGNTNLGSAVFSPDRTKILCSSPYSGECILWDTTGTVINKYTGENSDFYSIAFTYDGTKILSGSYYGDLKFRETMPTLEEFLRSGRIDELTPEQKNEFGIR